ncbi:MAG: amidohydrolase family protein [Acidimicrobiales bacterium]
MDQGSSKYREPVVQVLRANLVVGIDGPLEPGVVEIADDGTIASVAAGSEMAPGARPVDLDILAPGFVDLQVNGIEKVDVATADGTDWDVLDQLLLAQGVTTWCPTLVTAPPRDTEQSCQRVKLAMLRPGAGRPEIAGIHLEGPFISVPGAHRREFVRDQVDPSFAENLDPAVRIVTLAPEIPGAMDSISALSVRGVLVSIGHSACTAEQAHQAAGLGARLVTHLGNAMGPFHHRNPGLMGAALTDDRLAVSVIGDLEHVHADVIRLAFAAKPEDRVVLVTDAVATGYGHVGPVELAQPMEPDGAVRAARLRDGTLAGSSLRMDRAVSNAVSFSGVGIARAVSAASATPAKLLGLKDRGAIAPGMRADLVALDRNADLAVVAVWITGHRVLAK